VVYVLSSSSSSLFRTNSPFLSFSSAENQPHVVRVHVGDGGTPSTVSGEDGKPVASSAYTPKLDKNLKRKAKVEPDLAQSSPSAVRPLPPSPPRRDTDDGCLLQPWQPVFAQEAQQASAARHEQMLNVVSTELETSRRMTGLTGYAALGGSPEKAVALAELKRMLGL
jgi:hypothetical protein